MAKIQNHSYRKKVRAWFGFRLSNTKSIVAGVEIRLSRIATNQLPQFTDRASMVLVPVCHGMTVGTQHAHVGSWVDSCCSRFTDGFVMVHMPFPFL